MIDQDLLRRFIDAATCDARRAEEMLAANPEIAGSGLPAALVLGDWDLVQSQVANNPALVTANTGPDNCPPLVYVCFSRFAAGHHPRAAGLVETARVLLRYGADPNTPFTSARHPDCPLSCLYAATGLNNNPALGLLLLEAGADPNDGESLYHSTEHIDLACTKLLLSHGAKVPGSNALKHILDREDLEAVQLILAAGADPNETNERGETALHWAVTHRRSPAIVTALLDSGADLNAKRSDGRTAYAFAVVSGQTEVAALLQSRGADTDIPPLSSAGSERLLPELASSHSTAAVRELLAAGVPVDARGDLGATALHWSCWKGYADLVELLLAHHAPLDVHDKAFNAVPAGWFAHGVHNCHEEGSDYASVARLLIAAGANPPREDLPTGKPDVDAVLREHGLI